MSCAVDYSSFRTTDQPVQGSNQTDSQQSISPLLSPFSLHWFDCTHMDIDRWMSNKLKGFNKERGHYSFKRRFFKMLVERPV